MLQPLSLGGPESSTDNGDGTFTFTFGDGRQPVTAAGPVAKAKHDSLEAEQPTDPAMAAAFADRGDRTAQMGPMGMPAPSQAQQDDARRSIADVGHALVTPLKDLQPPTREGQSVPGVDTKNPAAPLPSQFSGDATGDPTINAATRLEPGQAAQQVDPSKLSFGAGGSGGFGMTPSRTYVAPTKAAWVPGRKTEQEGFHASEGLQTARDAAQGLSAQAAEDQYGAQQQKTSLETTLAANRADAVGLELAQDQARMQKQQQQVAARMSQLDQLGDDISKEKIDPRQIYTQHGLFSAIPMSIAAAAGAFAQGISGAPSATLGQLNKMVEQNIAGQQANLAHKKEMYGAKKDQLKLIQQNFANENEQDAAHRVLTWKAIDAQLDAQKAKLGAAFDDAAYTQMKAGVAQKIADARGGYEKEAQTQTAIVSGYQPARAGGYVNNGPTASPLQHNLFVPQFGGIAGTEKEAIDARAAGATLQGIDSLTRANLELRKNAKAFIPGTDENAQLASNQAQLALQLKNTEKLGVLAGPDMGLITGAIGDGTSIKPGQSAALENYLGNAKQRNDFVRQNLGIIPVQLGAYQDPKTGEMKMGQTISGNVAGPVNAPRAVPYSQGGAVPPPTAQPPSFQSPVPLTPPGGSSVRAGKGGPSTKRRKY